MRVEKILCNRQMFNHRQAFDFRKKTNRNMNKRMGSSLRIEKLDRSNYASWAYKMHQYLLGHGYWRYVEGANDASLEPTHRDFLG